MSSIYLYTLETSDMVFEKACLGAYLPVKVKTNIGGNMSGREFIFRMIATTVLIALLFWLATLILNDPALLLNGSSSSAANATTPDDPGVFSKILDFLEAVINFNIFEFIFDK